jgi:dinuclear metal center YbgI/SA1388 family protein
MPKTVRRDDLVAYLDRYLRVADIPDSSPNGLQVQGTDKVARLAFAVDASVKTIRAAAKARANFLVVHHGLWWGRHEQIVGRMHARVAALIENDVSLYTAHLPLDCHQEVGNNVELARLLSLRVAEPFGEYKGVNIGVVATATPSIPLDTLVSRVEKKLTTEADVLGFGPSSSRRIAIVSGGGAAFVDAAALAQCDTLLTGETSHAAYPAAEEAGINLIFAGHYATETVGLEALQRHVRKRFGLASEFVSAPTGF